MAPPSPIRLLVPPPGNGDFLTDLVGELLVAQGYEISQKNVHLPGREIDLVAIHRRNKKQRILAECKATAASQGGDSINKLAGLPEMRSAGTTGYFVSLGGFTETAIAQEKDRRKKIVFLDGAGLMDDLIRAHLVVAPGRALEQAVRCAAAVGEALAADERLELLAHPEIGWTWAVRFQVDGVITHVALIDASGIPLPRARVSVVQEADRAVGGNLSALTVLYPPARAAVDDSAELDRAEAAYLASLKGDFEYLKLKGIAVDNIPLRLPLAEMYVPLHAELRTAGDGRRGFGRGEVPGTANRSEEGEPQAREGGGRTAILDLLGKQPGLVLLGEPGSGKTTLLKYLALRLARGEGEALGLGRRLPLVVGLADYAARAAEVPLARFFQEHCQRVRELGGELPFERMAARALAEGRALVLLDGLDEVREESERFGIARRVENLFGFHHAAGNRFLVTSRIEGYVPLEAPALAVGTLAPFTDEDVEAFVSRWTALAEAAAGDPEAARRDAERERRDLLAAVTTHEKIRELASNPLMLTILALMKRQRVVLPERRVELYQKYVETLLHNWHLARPMSGVGRKPTFDDKVAMRILAPLALWIQETVPGRGRVEKEALRTQLVELWRQINPADAEEQADRFLQEFPREASLLLEVGYRQYAFLHLSFLEYLAAVAVARKGGNFLLQTVTAHLGDANWHEVSRLALGFFQLSQDVEPVLEDLATRREGLPGEGEVMAALALADIGSGVVSHACRQRVIDSLLAAMTDDGRVPAPARATAGRAVAGVGDPRKEVMTLAGMATVLCDVPAGRFLLGSTEADQWAYSDEKPQHEVELPYAFRIAKYPVTVAQFEEYLERSGREPEDVRFRSDPGNCPVTAVSWEEAMAFCRWLTELWRKEKLIGGDETITLPSEAEWERAARGVDGWIFPWGNEPDPNRANYDEAKVGNISPVGCFPSGRSPAGCEEMVGNVWEWTRSALEDYPYDRLDGREDARSDSRFRVVRGGSFGLDFRLARCAVRYRGDPAAHVLDVGFRPAVLLFSSGL